MQLLRKCVSFSKDKDELEHIYILFICSILEQSCVLWHISLSQKDPNNLERVQKSAVKVILNDKFDEYELGLQNLNLQT